MPGSDAVVEFIDTVHRSSPDTVILLDEAYHDYVTDPSHTTGVPLSLARDNVIVARTFSKAYGLAGMRLGYPAETFRNACADKGIHVGRDFPPLEKTHCRISIGTMDEMKSATEVSTEVLKEVA